MDLYVGVVFDGRSRNNVWSERPVDKLLLAAKLAYPVVNSYDIGEYFVNRGAIQRGHTMRQTEGVTLESAIAHLVNPRTANGYVLSERALPLGSQQHLSTYFAEHIQNSLADPSATAARFDQANGGALLKACSNLLDKKSGFVKQSVTIAQELHSIISADQRISPGALVVCTYKAANKSDPRFLAILKLDPSEVFQPMTKTDSAGRKYVTFKEIHNVIPTTGERLQKCAFIRKLPSGSTDYDMMLLDLQKRGSKEPARFFQRDFLGAIPFGDAQTLTKEFYLAAIKGLNDIRSLVDAKEFEQVRKAIDVAVNSTSVDVDDWLKKLKLKKKPKDRLAAVVDPATPNRSFHTDPKWAQRLTRRRVLKGDHGLRLSVEAQFFDQVVTKEKKSDANGDYWELVIRTTDLEEVAK